MTGLCPVLQPPLRPPLPLNSHHTAHSHLISVAWTFVRFLLHFRINLLFLELSLPTSLLPFASSFLVNFPAGFLLSGQPGKPTSPGLLGPSLVVSDCHQIRMQAHFHHAWQLSQEGWLSPSSCESPRGRHDGPWPSRPDVWSVLCTEGLLMVMMERGFLIYRMRLVGVCLSHLLSEWGKK